MTHVSTACKEASPQIPWKEMKDLRNVLIYQYFIVDPEEIWAISSHDVPKLHAEVQRILQLLSTEI